MFATSNNKIFRSTDNGINWFNITKNFSNDIEINEITGDSLFLFIGSKNNGIWRLPIGIFYPPLVKNLNVKSIKATIVSITGEISSFGYNTSVVLQYCTDTNLIFKDSILSNYQILLNNQSVNFKLTKLSEGTKYFYRIKGTNSAGIFSYSSYNYFTTPQFSKINHVASRNLFKNEAEADSVNNKVSPITAPVVGLILNQNITGTKVLFSSRSFTSKTWKDTLITSLTDTFFIKLLHSQFDEIGLEYTFKLFPPSGFSSGLISDTISAITRVSIKHSKGLNFPGILKSGVNSEDYNLLSFPLDLDEKSAGSIVYPALKLNQPDDTKYRFLTYVGNNGNYKNIWQANPENVFPGKGYWFTSKSPINFLNTGVGKTVANHINFDGENFTIILKPKYNQIGNPYLFPVSWEDIKETTDDLRLGKLFGYVSTQDSTTITSINNLQPYSGGYVYNSGEHDLLLKIPALKNKIANRLRFHSANDDKTLIVNLSLTNGLKNNKLSEFGIHPLAQKGYDIYDQQLIAFPGNFPTIFFKEDEPLLSSFQADNDTVNTWEISSKGLEQSESSFSWEINMNKDCKELWLHDLLNEKVIDMQQTKVYTFSGNRDFKIYSGSKEVLKSNVSIQFNQVRVFPMPIKNKAIISFSLPKNANSLNELYKVNITVFDVTGNIIAKLDEKLLESGYHEVEIQNNPEFQGMKILEVLFANYEGISEKRYSKVTFE